MTTSIAGVVPSNSTLTTVEERNFTFIATETVQKAN